MSCKSTGFGWTLEILRRDFLRKNGRSTGSLRKQGKIHGNFRGKKSTGCKLSTGRGDPGGARSHQPHGRRKRGAAALAFGSPGSWVGVSGVSGVSGGEWGGCRGCREGLGGMGK